jgi:hypothetical protein
MKAIEESKEESGTLPSYESYANLWPNYLSLKSKRLE